MKIRHTLVALAILLTVSLHVQGYPCIKYAFHFYQQATEDFPPGDIVLSWKIRYPGACGFAKEEIENKKFVVTVVDFFEQALLVDTVATPAFHFKLGKGEHVIVRVEEINTDHEISLVIRQLASMVTIEGSRIDSLNSTLSNGFFSHALALLYKMNRPELIKKVIAEHELLFPIDYRGSRKIFNSYFDQTINDLVQMPYVTATSEFLQLLSELVASHTVGKIFEIQATFGINDRVEDVITTPAVDNQLVVQAMDLLKIDTHSVSNAKLLMIIDTSKKNWKLINERTLTDPSSKAFKFRPRLATGAIH